MMRLVLPLLVAVVVGFSVGCKVGHELDYDRMVILDAESLAEAGIGEAYQALLPKLREFVEQPAEVEELEDSDRPSYSVRSQGVE